MKKHILQILLPILILTGCVTTNQATHITDFDYSTAIPLTLEEFYGLCSSEKQLASVTEQDIYGLTESLTEMEYSYDENHRLSGKTGGIEGASQSRDSFSYSASGQLEKAFFVNDGGVRFPDFQTRITIKRNRGIVSYLWEQYDDRSTLDLPYDPEKPTTLDQLLISDATRQYLKRREKLFLYGEELYAYSTDLWLLNSREAPTQYIKTIHYNPQQNQLVLAIALPEENTPLYYILVTLDKDMKIIRSESYSRDYELLTANACQYNRQGDLARVETKTAEGYLITVKEMEWNDQPSKFRMLWF